MCFITKRSTLKRAEKDIICYKIMGRAFKKSNTEIAFFESYYRYFKYEPGIIYGGKSKLNMWFCHLLKLNIDRGGYHSYISECKVWNDIVVKCIIPKGSLYLENKIDNEYCSTAIKIIKDI